MTVMARFALHIRTLGGEVTTCRQWIENFDLPVERERRFPDRDHHLSIGRAELPLEAGVWHGIAASLDPNAPTDSAAALAPRRTHDRRALDRTTTAHPNYAEAPGWVRRLILASDLYVIERPVSGVADGRSVIAGYPWFGDWGRDTQRPVLDECGEVLLTSYGLRSLAPGHRDCRGRYRGGVVERDGSYDHCPVWAWLLGHFALAHYRVNGDAAAQGLLEPIADHLADAGFGQISEISDGDPPHTPRGAPAQAWSVASVLEAWRRLQHARLTGDSKGE
jgi:glycogen debranching enzyme